MSDEETVNTDDLTFIVDADSLENGERVITEVKGREIAVFNINGEFQAVSNYCVHQGGPACEGLVSGTLMAENNGDEWELCYKKNNRIVSCPWHGWEFDIETGEHLARSDYSLPTYEVVEKGGKVYLDL